MRRIHIRLTGRRFELKQRNSTNENGECDSVEVTVYGYFLNTRKMELQYSADLPCINVGKPKRPTYIPLELCSLIPLQRYTKPLNTLKRSALVEKSRQKPQEIMNVLTKALQVSNYDTEPLLRSCGILISSNFTQVEGRVLQAPKVQVGDNGVKEAEPRLEPKKYRRVEEEDETDNDFYTLERLK